MLNDLGGDAFPHERMATLRCNIRLEVLSSRIVVTVARLVAKGKCLCLKECEDTLIVLSFVHCKLGSYLNEKCVS